MKSGMNETFDPIMLNQNTRKRIKLELKLKSTQHFWHLQKWNCTSISTLIPRRIQNLLFSNINATCIKKEKSLQIRNFIACYVVKLCGCSLCLTHLYLLAYNFLDIDKPAYYLLLVLSIYLSRLWARLVGRSRILKTTTSWAYALELQTRMWEIEKP